MRISRAIRCIKNASLIEILAALVAIALSGCGATSQEPPAPAPPQKTVFDPMTRQIGRVQKLTDELPKERKDNLDTAIDADSN